MQKEYDALLENDIWELVSHPSNTNIIRFIWIVRHKTNSDGSFEQYKAHLVGDGKSERDGVDCDKTFSPVGNMLLSGLFLALLSQNHGPFINWMLKIIFLHGPLNETIYIDQPLGFRNPTLPDYIFQFRKSLYGLRQASWAGAWH